MDKVVELKLLDHYFINLKLLLLDEPTVGLDIGSRQMILKHVKTLCKRNNLAVLWATHLIDEIEKERKLLL